MVTEVIKESHANKIENLGEKILAGVALLLLIIVVFFILAFAVAEFCANLILNFFKQIGRGIEELGEALEK